MGITPPVACFWRFLSEPFLVLRDRSRRYANNRCPRCNICKHNGVRADNRASTDTDIAEDAGTSADCDVVLDDRSARFAPALTANDNVGRDDDIRAEARIPVNDDAKALITECDVPSDLYRRWQGYREKDTVYDLQEPRQNRNSQLKQQICQPIEIDHRNTGEGRRETLASHETRSRFNNTVPNFAVSDASSANVSRKSRGFSSHLHRMLLQLLPSLAKLRKNRLHRLPEPGAMVHLAQMCELMCNHIIDNGEGKMNQPPVQANSPFA